MQLTENFHANEFRCNCAGRGVAKGPTFCHGIEWVHRELVVQLQTLRLRLMRPITVVSGCRCSAYNAHVGGARGSQHLRGKAADLRVAGLNPLEVALEAAKVGFRGIRNYPSFCHVDTREGDRWHDITER